MKTVDEGLAPIREVRHEISRQFGHDPHRYVDYLKTLETHYAKQIEAFRNSHLSQPELTVKRIA